MESKKINQLATNVAPQSTDLTIIGDPITGVSKKITFLQVSTLIGTAANLQQVTDNGATTTNPIAIGGLTITGLATGVLKSDSGVISSVPFGAANGVATLGGDGKVPSIQLPSYVDDVVEVANFAALPVTGETGKLYITLDNNKVYRWTGSIYVEIAANNAVWGAITGTLSNQTDLQNALNAKQNTITLTTTGTSGASTLVGSTLNIPNYAPDLSGYVPYTGATTNVNLGTFDLTADVITGATGSFASNGSSDSFAINHSSGSGIALNITKGGAGEGLYINKTSGSGNAATIIGTLNATTLVKSGGTSSQFLKADGSVDSSTYLTTSAAASTYVPYSGATTTVNLNNQSLTNCGFISSNGFSNADIALRVKNTTSGSFSTAVGFTSIHSSANYFAFHNSASQYAVFNYNGGNFYTLPSATGTLALTSDLGAYLPLTGGTLSGALNINLNSGTGLNVSTENVVFRSSPAYGSPRQLVFSMGSGPTTTLEAKGYGANYITDFNIITHNASGTAFNVFFGTAQGDVGIGNNSPSTKLDVNGTGRFTSSLGIGITPFPNTLSSSLDMVNGAGLWGYSNDFILTGNAYYNGGWLYKASSFATRINGDGAGAILFSNASSGTAGGSLSWNERMRITSGGNVGIGTSSPAAKFVVAASTAGSIAEIYNERNSSSGDFALVTSLGANANNTNSYHYIAATGGADKFYVYGNGTYTSVSDKKLKKNISKVTDTYLDKVLGLNIVNYNWNEQEDGSPLELGMIAQEVEELIPSIVHEGRKQEDGNIYKGIQVSSLPYILIKAIQEQQAQIEELKAKIK